MEFLTHPSPFCNGLQRSLPTPLLPLRNTSEIPPWQSQTLHRLSVLIRITKLDKKITFYNDESCLLPLISAEVAGLYQYFGCTIPETKCKVRKKGNYHIHRRIQSLMKHLRLNFWKSSYGFNTLTIFVKNSILNNWLSS